MEVGDIIGRMTPPRRRSRATVRLIVALAICTVHWGGTQRSSAGTDLDSQVESQTVPPLSADASSLLPAGDNEYLAATDSPSQRSSVPLAEGLALALDRANRSPADPTAQLAQIEALLALGRPPAAEQVAIGLLTQPIDGDRASKQDPRVTAGALRLWMLARLRQALTLDESRLQAPIRALGDEPALAALRFWSDSLGGRSPYRIATGSLPVKVNLERRTVWSHLQSRRIEGIAATIGDVRLPLVFVDTGAHYTILSPAAAQAAGVAQADRGSEMVGFGTFGAAAALIPELRLGGLTIRDVPVFVGDSPALARAKGQMAIGTDLMHHLRFTLDGRAGQVTIEPTVGAAPLGQNPPPGDWQVRLFPLPKICLAEAHLPGSGYARVLIDTGNWEGTFVSSRWARQNDLDVFGRRRALWLDFQRGSALLSGFELGGQRFDDWPVRSTLPAELDRLDLFDIIVGHDLLRQHRVTIDLALRLLRCERTEP